MHESLLQLLRSPLKGKKMELEIFEVGKIEQSGEQIISGRLYNNDEEYPIINGIPRLLTGDLLGTTLKRYSDFVKKFKGKFRKLHIAQAPLQNDLKKNTQESFGVQWNLFPTMYEEWRDNFIDFISPHLLKEDFDNKVVLDCGCGIGRHLYYAAEFGARHAVGMDISHSVDMAIKNVSKFDNAHIIQADIYNIPLIYEFDISYCIGVLQHLPDPVKAFCCISETLKTGGIIFAWIYGKRPIGYHLIVDSLRRFTVGMKPNGLYRLTFVLALLSFGMLALPRRIFSNFGMKKLGEKIPFSRYANYPFQVSHADWYDRLAAPKTEYFDEDFPKEMLNKIDCTEKRVTFREGGSWKVYAKI